jgi:hypothetical protein
MEEDITIYYLSEGQEAWQALATKLNPWDNFASASTQGSGLYALLTSFRVPLGAAGWNLFSYPLRGSQPVTHALASIDGTYSTVYGYDSSDEDQPWRVYDVSAPDYVNDLEELAFGQGYWISVTQPVTAHFGSEPSEVAASAAMPPHVPATYYGPVVGASSGLPVTAWVDGTLCGQSQTMEVDGQTVYAVHVFAEAGGPVGCGVPGRQVHFQVGDQMFLPAAVWDTSRLHRVPLRAGEPRRLVYLPALLREN